MKAVRKLSTSIHNVGNMITNKISDVKTKGGTQLKLQVICPADGYPGKQITISTPDHQMLSVIIPKRVMPGRPFNIVYTLCISETEPKTCDRDYGTTECRTIHWFHTQYRWIFR